MTLLARPTLAPGEAVWVRVALAAVALLSLSTLPSAPSLDFPVGLAAAVDLGVIGSAAGRVVIVVGALLGALLLVRGGGRRRLAAAVGLLLLPQLLAATAWNSQGFAHHGHQAVTLALAGACIAVLIDDVGDESSLLFGAQLLVASCYLGAGVAKMVEGAGFAFVTDAPLLAVEVVKTARQHQADHALAMDDVDRAHAVATWILAHPHVARAAAAGTILLEVSVWLGVGSFGRGALIGVLVVAMHRAILAVMGLSFPLWELLVIACFVRPLAAIGALRARERRLGA